MLTSPAWLTRRSSSGARTRTADCVASVRSTGLAVPLPSRAKRDQSIVAGSFTASLAAAGAGASALAPRPLPRPRSSRLSRPFFASPRSFAASRSVSGASVVTTNGGGSSTAGASGAGSLGRALGASGAVAAATASE